MAIPRDYWFALCLVMTIGCGKSTKPAATSGNIAGRLSAALNIRDVGEKDQALAQLAKDATDGGDAATAEQAISAIRSVTDKADAAYSVAQRLAKAGKAEAATTMAKGIRDMAIRDKVLGNIAKGETSE